MKIGAKQTMNGIFNFIIVGRKHSIVNLGKDMNVQFLNLHQTYLTNQSCDFDN
jgi:hypothetical protein